MVGRRIFVYRNLSNRTKKNGRYSIQSREGKDYGLVIGHADDLVLRDCVFKVSEAGRQRVLRNRCKDVHAGILGYVDSRGMRGGVQVKYDPYESGSFFTTGRKKLAAAKRVHLTRNGVFAK